MYKIQTRYECVTILHKGLSRECVYFFDFSSSHTFKDLEKIVQQIMGLVINTRLWLFYLRGNMKESVLTIFWKIAQKSEKILSLIFGGLMQD